MTKGKGCLGKGGGSVECGESIPENRGEGGAVFCQGGNCGGKANVENYEECGNISFCVNYPIGPSNKHGSFDKKCPRFLYHILLI